MWILKFYPTRLGSTMEKACLFKLKGGGEMSEFACVVSAAVCHLDKDWENPEWAGLEEREHLMEGVKC